PMSSHAPTPKSSASCRATVAPASARTSARSPAEARRANSAKAIRGVRSRRVSARTARKERSNLRFLICDFRLKEERDLLILPIGNQKSQIKNSPGGRHGG